jgi:hypothetical protein
MLDLDISDVEQAEADAVDGFRGLGGRMRSAVQLGAQYERDNKTYQNRTGDLLRSTKGRLDRNSKDEIVAELEMGMGYADHVRALGFSAIDEAANRADVAIADAIEAVGDKVAG